jgi:RNA 3'-terminal phosphate cyclase (ATP)
MTIREKVFLPTLISACGFPLDLIEHRVVRRGYYPKGWREARIEVEPWQEALPPIVLTERGELSKIRISSYYAGDVPVASCRRNRHVGHENVKKGWYRRRP